MDNRTIDLRSDTITKPTPAMLEAMLNAKVGDDVFDDDPTVNAFQERIANYFGMESALFCPSGTMTNQIAMRISTSPQDEVICDKRSHVYLYEGGGMAYNSMLSPKLLDGDRGRITSKMVESAVNPKDIHFPKSSLVAVENTMNKGGGSIYALSELKAIKRVCVQNDMKFHLDGARLFNALVETDDNPKTYGKLFDTISICFSKGLGAPVGSVLLSSKELNWEAKRLRKVLGGGMRQIGYLAAACMYAMDHHIDRLVEDHERARIIGKALGECKDVESVLPVDTNIVIGELLVPASKFIAKLESHNILSVPFGPNSVRFVTHLDFTDDDLEQLLTVLKKIG